MIFPELSIEETITRAQRFNEVTNFGVTREDIARLLATAPTWPKEPGHIRSLRLHNGEQRPDDWDDAQSTYDAHVKMLEHVHGDEFHNHHTDSRYACFVTRNPAYGEHLPRKRTVEWVVMNLFVRGEGYLGKVPKDGRFPPGHRHPQRVSDELLVAAWLHPEVFRMTRDKLGTTKFRAAQYESCVSCGEYVWDRLFFVCNDRKRQSHRQPFGIETSVGEFEPYFNPVIL